jgi:protein involved in polysaccharide export with SLBB domain
MDTRPVPIASIWSKVQTAVILTIASASLGLTGCTTIFNPIPAIPADQVPPAFLVEPRANWIPVDVALLGQQKPEHYLLDQGDVLGIFAEGVLGEQGGVPPVAMPEPQSDLDPAIGFPVPVREDGTVSLPLLDPLPVRGLTVTQAEELVKQKYIAGNILQPTQRILVTLMRKRTTRVFVIRQDNTTYGDPRAARLRRGAVTDRPDYSSRGFVLQMPAYENDILNALADTGGLPGVNAKNEVKILRAARNDAARMQDGMVFDPNLAAGVPGGGGLLTGVGPDGNLQLAPCIDPCLFPYGVIPPAMMGGGQTIVIPLRLRPGDTPRFRPEDVILNDGDVVMVETRDTEVYYTGGEMIGGEWPLPRDYDLDVLGAVSLAREGITGAERRGGGLISVIGLLPPTELIVLRKLPANQQLAIRVDLTRAVNDPSTRILVAPGDSLILRHKPIEDIVNFGVATFFTFGIRELFRN